MKSSTNILLVQLNVVRMINLIFITALLVLTSLVITFMPTAYSIYNGTINPTIADPKLKVQLVADGLDHSTSMAFLGPNDILALNKNDGTVQRVVNGTVLKEPLLDVAVSYKMDRGMLGIAVAKHENGGPTYVFLYFTQSSTGKDSYDYNSASANRLYRYEFKDDKLTDPKLLLNVTATTSNESAMHNGGKLRIGPDQNLYLVVGDLKEHVTKAQNKQNGPPPDGTSVIYRITQDGKPPKDNPLGRNLNVNKFYAYGIRESFGMDFDPVTGKLWDTENGVDQGDEINLVDPGFNSGWKRQQGYLVDSSYPDQFVNLGENGKEGKYSDPEFVWNVPVGPSDLTFLNSDKLGKQYENHMFVGDANTGNLYDFKLDEKRTKLILYTPLADRMANTIDELQHIIFGQSFGIISDLEVGPDGYLYVLTYQGTLYRVIPSS
jgi:aldose sugar dehydrogenase